MAFFFLIFKEFLFFSPLLDFNHESIFMCRILSLVYLLISFFPFVSLDYSSKFIYSLYFSFLCFFLFFVFTFSDCFYFLVALESTVFLIWFLVLNFSKDFDKLDSVLFLVLVNLRGSLPFIIFTLSSDETRLYFSRVFFFNSDLIILFFMVLLFVCKIPIFFFHLWLLKAHVSASGRCSILLARLLLKIGTFGLIKFSPNFIFCTSSLISFLFSLGCVSRIYFTLRMLRFFDMKYLIACSSVLHIGIMLPMRFSECSVGVFSIIFIMVGHGLVSFILFFLISLLYELTFNRTIDLNKCLHSTRKFYLLFFFIYSFLNLGFPPFINFIREIFRFNVIYSYSNLILILFSMTALIRIFFSFYIICKLVFGKKINILNSDVLSSSWAFRFFYLLFIFFSLFLF